MKQMKRASDLGGATAARALVLAVAVSAMTGATIRAQDRSAIDHAKQVFAPLEQDKYDDVAKEFNGQMTAAMTPDQLRGARATLHDRVGAFQRSIDEQSVVPQPGITAVVLGSQFEKGAVNVIVAFDADGKIAGIRLTPRP